MSSLSSRLRSAPSGFIEPCLPSAADKPPSGSNWIHEIKHEGYRLMARRDPVGIRLLTRNGHDWATRYPLIVEAVNHLRSRSVMIDGEVVCCDDRGLATFQLLRHRRNEPKAFLYAFDLLERWSVSGVFPPSCSERHSSEDANQLMASVRIYGRPYS